MSVRVLLAEEQATVRGALSALLDLEEDIEIVAEASRGDEVYPNEAGQVRAQLHWDRGGALDANSGTWVLAPGAGSDRASKGAET